MQVSCVQENLAKGLSIVGRAVAARSTLPVLSNVLLETDSSRLKLAATNLDFAGPTTGFRLDARGRTNSTCQVSTSGTGTSLVNNISQIANQASNSQPFILDENQEITLLPGDALQIFNVTVNQDTRGAFIWRERFLEDSERA